MKIQHNTSVRSLQIFNHLIGLIGIAWAITSGELWYLVVAWLTYWAIGILGINIGYHRLLSHRSFQTYPLIEKFLGLVGVITTVGSPMAWTAVHRQHHRAAETERDVHSPYQLGGWRAWFGFWNIKHIEMKLIRDLRQDPWQRFLHKRYFAIILAYVIVLALIDPWLVIFAYAVPACLCLHSTSAIIVIAHHHGYRTYDLGRDRAANSWIANFITMGEGWHNNHHARPWAWSNWERWWEWDVPSVIIRLIKTDAKTA